MIFRAFLLLVSALAAGCSTLTTHVETNAGLAKLRYVYVVENLNDNHDIHEVIVRELKARGIDAGSGPLTLMPESAKAYLNYDDNWTGDIPNYLMTLGMTLREARSDRFLATVTYVRPTAFFKSPGFMVQKALAGLFTGVPLREPIPEAARPNGPPATEP